MSSKNIKHWCLAIISNKKISKKYQKNIKQKNIKHGVWGHYILNNYIIYAIPFTQFSKIYLRYTYIIVVIMP